MPNINDFKSRLAGGGARANQFKVTMPFPGYAAVGGETADLAFLCTSTSIPGQNLGTIAVPFRGRVLQIAGDRTFNPFSITVLNDTDFKIYRAMERWMNGINNHNENTGLAVPVAYEADLKVEQLDREGDIIKTYNFRGSYPQDLSPIALSFGDNDNIERFTCTWAYQYWESNTTT